MKNGARGIWYSPTGKHIFDRNGRHHARSIEMRVKMHWFLLTLPSHGNLFCDNCVFLQKSVATGVGKLTSVRKTKDTIKKANLSKSFNSNRPTSSNVRYDVGISKTNTRSIV